MTGRTRHSHWMAFAAALAMAVAASAHAQGLEVRAAVEKQEVSVGEPFMFQIQVQGSDRPEAPDLSAIRDFTVEQLGGQQNNSQSITIVNGRMANNVQRGYAFNYRLTAKQIGRFTIPSLRVMVEGQALQTQPMPISVVKPEETEDFKLRLAFSSEKCYVGEPVVLTVTWYLSKNVRNLSFAIPFLTDNRISVEDPEDAQEPGKEYIRVPIGGQQAIAEKTQEVLDGRTYTALRFRKVVVPKQAGALEFTPATVACEALVPAQQGQRQRRRSPFDDFFSDNPFGGGGVYKNFVSTSNPLHLEVSDVPQDGRPANFNGLIGAYTIATSATPTDVNVGDPITLTIRISGSAWLKRVELPPLDKQPDLASNFKIPKEMAAGKLENGAKVFTQTLRAQAESVNQIPAISLSYFDTKTGSYETARSKPIPITVHPTRVVTTQQVEAQTASVLRSELTARKEGIAHNYEDAGVLENQDYGPGRLLRSPAWLLLLIAPPVAWASVAGFVMARRRDQLHPESRRARRALGELQKRLDAAQAASAAPGALLEALRAYLGHRLGIPAAAMTFEDARKALVAKGLDEEALAELRTVFGECEAWQYAGAQGASDDTAPLAARVLAVARKVEKGAAR